MLPNSASASHHASHQRSGWKIIALYAGAVVALGVAVVILFAVLVNGRVLPGTSAGGAALGFATIDDARSTIEQTLRTYESQPLSLTLDGIPATGTLAQFGLSIDHERTLAALEKRSFTWGVDNPLFAGANALHPDSVRAVVTIDKNVAEKAVAALTSAKTTAAIDAVFSVPDGVATVSPERSGFGFDVSLVEAQLVHHVAALDATALTLTSQTIAPGVTAALLEPARVQAAAFVAEPIVLKAASKTLRIKAKELGTWVMVDPTTHALAANTDGIKATVKRFAQQVDTKSSPKIMVAGTSYVIDPGSDNTGIDQVAALAALTPLVTAAAPLRAVELAVTSVPAPVKEVGSTGAPSTGSGKEIVVVLSEQRLYAWEDGTLAKTFLISSGSTYPTYPGTFAVYNKIKDHTMAGPGYNLPHVPDSMYFDGPRAVHGAYWHHNFGHPMSHGCINEPLPEALWLYNWTPVGTTVRVVE